MFNFGLLRGEIERLPTRWLYGGVTAVQGLMVEIGGLAQALPVGGRVRIERRHGGIVPCEVVGFRNGRALLLPYGALEGIGVGSKAEIADALPVVHPDRSWLGRVV
ncbi:MAG: flagellum-specific ATP synthase FliI, partial [Alphaproteobacteria bacterium]|nr:flagellum-specific ATP synthase FliI [Alphaproteobacteria bacterium]